MIFVPSLHSSLTLRPGIRHEFNFLFENEHEVSDAQVRRQASGGPPQPYLAGRLRLGNPLMVKHNCIPLESSSEWKDALRGIKHSFGHTWEHCYAMHLTTGSKTFLYCFQSENVRIVCPIAEREYDGYVDIVKPFGFSGFVGNGDCFDFPRYWNEFVRHRGYVCGYLGLNPIFDYSTHFTAEEIYQHDMVYVLDIRKSPDELLAGMSAKRRQHLRNWDDTRPLIVQGEPSLTEFLLKNYYDFLRSRGAPSFYFFSQETLSFLLNQKNVFLIGAQVHGTVVAVTLVTYTSEVADGLINISLPRGQKFSAALIWYAVNYLKSIQIPTFNLGGGAGTSLGDFKERFGCKKLPLRSIKQIYEPEIYAKLCQRAQVDPSDKSSYFPAYRKGANEVQAEATG